MSRDFIPNDIIETTAGGATRVVFPFSYVSRWFLDIAQGRQVAQVKHDANTDLSTLFINPTGPTARAFIFSNGGAGPGAGKAASPSNTTTTGTWNTSVATYTSTLLECILNGDFANRGSIAHTASAAATTRICYGAERRLTGTIFDSMDGRMAESAVLKVIATEDEMNAFAAGYDVESIWPAENIHHYRNFIREIDDPPIGAALTDSGTTQIEHPPETIYRSQEQGRRAFVPLPVTMAARGRSQVLNAWQSAARGRGKTGIDGFKLVARGRYSIRNSFEVAARGRYKNLLGVQMAARGRYVISTLVGQTFLMSARGRYVVTGARIMRAAARYRIANDALKLFELFIGIDAEPDLTAAPTETFAALPRTSGALVPGAGDRTFFVVLRLRNEFNLSSQNIQSWKFTMDNTGVLLVNLPTGPDAQDVKPAAAGNVRVTADYLYQVDGINQADTWAVFLTSNGVDPDPAVDVVFDTVTMIKADGIVKLDKEYGPFADALTIKVVVTTRRGSIQSNNTAVVQTIADTDGPPKPVAYAHIGDRATIVSTEGDNNL